MEITKFQEYPLPEKVGNGKESNVFRISNNHAAKTPIIPHEITLKNLEKEFEIAKILFDKGISVPKPEGIFFIKYDIHFLKSFIMEYIEGKNGFEISNEEYSYSARLWREELERARGLGFITYDSSHAGNFIWSPKKEKIYLIDFEMWEPMREIWK